MINMPKMLVSRQFPTFQETVKGLLSPALMTPHVGGCFVRYYSPSAQRHELLSEIVDPLFDFDCELFDNLSEEIKSFRTQPLTGILDVSHLKDSNYRYIYYFSLPFLSLENHLFIFTDVHVSTSKVLCFQAVSQAIASHIHAWQERHFFQARISELEATLGSVEHQFRQSLGLLNLNLSLLQQQAFGSQTKVGIDDLQATVNEISERLTTILHSHRQKLTSGPSIDLRQFINDRGRVFMPSLRERQVGLKIPKETVELQADPQDLGQVIDNLLCNAIAFSPEGSGIEWTWDTFDGEVLIQVSDQGPGIPQGSLLKIFQPGYTQRPQGQGLGLAITRKIVERYGGRIWANNLPAGGAQFSLIFPQTQPLRSSPVQF